jgi:hypothetical protein
LVEWQKINFKFGVCVKKQGYGYYVSRSSTFTDCSVSSLSKRVKSTSPLLQSKGVNGSPAGKRAGTSILDCTITNIWADTKTLNKRFAYSAQTNKLPALDHASLYVQVETQDNTSADYMHDNKEVSNDSGTNIEDLPLLTFACVKRDVMQRAQQDHRLKTERVLHELSSQAPRNS